MCVLAYLALASATSRIPQIVSQSLKNEPKVAEVQARFVLRKKQAQTHANIMSMRPVVKTTYRKCNFDSDCPGHQECVNYAPKLYTLKQQTRASTEQFGTIYTQIRAQDKRFCCESFVKFRIDTLMLEFFLILIVLDAKTSLARRCQSKLRDNKSSSRTRSSNRQFVILTKISFINFQ